MNSKTKQKTNLETSLRLGIFIVFTIYWVSSGFDLIKNLDLCSEFIYNHTENNTIFSWDALVFGIFYFALMCYPILIAMFLAFTIFDKNAFKELLTKRSVLYFLISPLCIILFSILFVFIGRIIIYAIGWALFLGYPIYLFFKWLYDKIRN